METCEDVVIVGGGLAGLVIAVALKRVGIRSLILERSDELRATGGVITLYPNAWRALEAIGIAHKLTPGGCAALEDAVVLSTQITSTAHIASNGFEKAVEDYVKERKLNVAGIVAGAYVTGWVQQGGDGWTGWLRRFVRDHMFYRFVFERLVQVSEFDCGRLTSE
ncbi:hypothetical protein QJS04_geneDACA024971 [Acorus gramineus]|uniref:FAD-binding domain-containing protein n=1 Tax=Acorus gramineus TaxID=55184 RepID=A0AAV9AIC6_ACOGR|nr:hypothetical protein QJS04_geneDACA024971 [Acorus gramineus]